MDHAAFHHYVLADTIRVGLGVFGVIYTMLCIKIATLRWTQRGYPPDPTLSLAWLSAASFALTTTAYSVQRFGYPPRWQFIIGMLLGLGFGVGSVLRQLQRPKWLFPSRRRPEKADEVDASLDEQVDPLGRIDHPH